MKTALASAQTFRAAFFRPRAKAAHQETAMVLVNLGNILSDRAEYDQAIAFYSEAIDLIVQHPAVEQKMEAPESTLQKVWQNLGLSYYQNQQLELARSAWEESLRYARQESDELAGAMVGFHLAQLEQRLGHRKKAADLYVPIAEVYQRHAFDFGIAEINQQMGMLLMDSGKADKAREAYQMALELFITLGLPRNMAQIYNNLAHVAFETGQFLEARDYYTHGWQLAHTHQVPQVEGWCLIGSGAVALEFDQFEQGRHHLLEAQAIFEPLNETGPLATIAFNQAKICQQEGDSAAALRYAKEALTLYQTLKEAKNIHAATQLLEDISSPAKPSAMG